MSSEKLSEFQNSFIVTDEEANFYTLNTDLERIRYIDTPTKVHSRNNHKTYPIKVGFSPNMQYLAT